MIIGIDASRVSNQERTGVENYSYNLIKALAKIDSTNHYRLYLRPNYDNSLNKLPANFELKIINRQKYWTQVGLSLEMLKNAPDVIFVPAHTLPLYTPKLTVLTIHDLAWRYFPEAYRKLDLFLHQLSIKRAIAKKARIIVYSNSTMNDLRQNFNVDEKLIRFVPMGFSPFENPKIGNNFAKFEPYILSVGRLEKRKNTLNIVKSYLLLRKERKIKHKLLLAGKPGYGYQEIKSEIEEAGETGKDIIELGYVPNEQLPELYHRASILVYPSLYEGFGYPILEAFSQDVPVITSNISSMPEVAGGAALLVNPQKVFEITAAMSQILNKPNLANKLKREGKKVLQGYSWETCAKETRKVLLER